MSSNQRPTKVRVLSSQSRPPAPVRRRGDPAVPDARGVNGLGTAQQDAEGQAGAAAVGSVQAANAAASAGNASTAGVSESAAKTGGTGRVIGLLMLFLVGCAMGGAALTIFGLGAR